jgi:NIMA (never in mitosis gene a)-related kinase
MSQQADFSKLLLKHGYTGVKKIGEGSFGVAVLVQDSDGCQSVCKSVKVGAAAMEDLLAAKKEARLLAHLQHPHIVRYRTSFLDLGWFCIVMDYCDGGSLAVQIERSAKKSSPMSEEQNCGLHRADGNGPGVLAREGHPAPRFEAEQPFLETAR